MREGGETALKKRKVVLIQGNPGEQSPQVQNLQSKYLVLLNLIGS